MKAGRAFLLGVVGGLVMSIGLAVGRIMGMPAELEMMLGTMFVSGGPTAWVLGFMVHLLTSGLLALVYALFFEHVFHGANWSIGVLLGFIHSLFAGMFMGIVPMFHPMIPEQMPSPGAFMANMGVMGIAAEIVLHMIYGAIIGAGYGPIKRSHAVTA